MTRCKRKGTAARGIPGSIWVLGLVSLFMDMSSEVIHSLLPVFMVSVLGASTVSVGFVEGIAEATASITKVFSGTLSDYFGRRKALTVLGYGLAAATKPLFALAPSVGWVFAARFIDRIGKGIRGAPRDALIADIAPPEVRGACYGLRQSLDTVGAVLGPLAAVGLMIVFDDDIRAVYWLAAIPAVISVALLAVAVPEPRRGRPPRDTAAPAGETKPHAPVLPARLEALRGDYWWIVIVGGLLTLARFSEAFLVLRAQSVGLTIALVPMVLVVMSLVYAASAYPAGILSDHIDRRRLLEAGFVVLVLADLVLASATNVALVFAGIVLWGLHMGLTQGLLATLVADAAPVELRGTAFGLFNLVVGVLLLVASALAGLLWDIYGAPAPFWAGAGFSGLAFLGIAFQRRR
ncbi:MAG: MFS transporter [Alphaproteobacteria bacterium]|nr:MAG: MFS transporter [Alphaproteobacteria bacterium]